MAENHALTVGAWLLASDPIPQLIDKANSHSHSPVLILLCMCTPQYILCKSLMASAPVVG